MKHKKTLIISSAVFLLMIFLGCVSFFSWINAGDDNELPFSVEAKLFYLADVASGNGAPLSASCDGSPWAVNNGCYLVPVSLCYPNSGSCGPASMSQQCTDMWGSNTCWHGDGAKFVEYTPCADIPCPPVCGNSVVESGEQCDTGGARGACPATCSLSCTTNTCITSYLLTVNKSGNGTVSSSPAGISCPADCTEPYSSGATVTLTATAGSGYYFSGWSGCDSPSGSQCIMLMSSAKTVSVTFTLSPVCTNDCSASGQTQCSGSNIQTCGNYDADVCLEWGGSSACACGCGGGICSTCDDSWKEVAP